MNFIQVKYNFKNKNVLVAGGSKGIGKGVVEAFVEAGANVFYASRNAIKNYSKAIHIEVDLRKESDIFRLFNRIKKAGGIDILVNSAGINYCKRIGDISLKEWEDVIALNLRSVFLTCREAVKMMKKNKSGKIVNISSIAGRHRSVVSGVHYVASKSAIIGLTKQLSYEVAKFGINVNAVCPSQTMTEMLSKSMNSRQIAELKKNIPLNRVAEVKEQVGPILFLCSDAASYITGTYLDVNGGQI